MRLLLDTHVFLWWLRDDRRLKTDVKSAVADSRNEIFVSAASIWEAAIKASLGKLEVEGDLVEEIASNGFRELPVSARQAQLAGTLPRHHDDPFDRLLVAQATVEGLVLASQDAAFRAYGVALLGRSPT